MLRTPPKGAKPTRTATTTEEERVTTTKSPQFYSEQAREREREDEDMDSTDDEDVEEDELERNGDDLEATMPHPNPQPQNDEIKGKNERGGLEPPRNHKRPPQRPRKDKKLGTLTPNNSWGDSDWRRKKVSQTGETPQNQNESRKEWRNPTPVEESNFFTPRPRRFSSDPSRVGRLKREV